MPNHNNNPVLLREDKKDNRDKRDNRNHSDKRYNSDNSDNSDKSDNSDPAEKRNDKRNKLPLSPLLTIFPLQSLKSMDYNAEERIQKRVKAKKGFLIHGGVYVAVFLFFLFMNIATFSESGEWWFFFPMMPWGVGLLIHYFSAFGFPGTKGLVEKWEIEETAREMRNMRETNTKTLQSGEEMDAGLELPDLKRRKDPQYNDDEFV